MSWVFLVGTWIVEGTAQPVNFVTQWILTPALKIIEDKQFWYLIKLNKYLKQKCILWQKHIWQKGFNTVTVIKWKSEKFH